MDEEAIMRVMAGEDPEEIATETEQTKPSANSTKKYPQAKEADQTGLPRTVL